MPNPSRQKGDRFERQLVDFLTERGVAAERIPLSGASPFGSFSGYDLTVTLFGTEMRAECKHAANGFRTLYNWLAHGSNDFLIIRADRAKPLAVIPLDLLADLATHVAADTKPKLPSQEKANDTPAKPIKRPKRAAGKRAEPKRVRSARGDGERGRVSTRR